MSVDLTAGRELPEFGRLMRQHRMRIGLTQRELADFSTISVRAIRDLEQGRAKRPRQATVQLIADGLRLGPRARAAFETAASQGRTSWSLKDGYESDPPAPPDALTPIIGRESEVGVIERELSTGAERLVNVVGLSGVGKTRLALEVANRLHTNEHLPVLWFTFPGAPVEHRFTAASERFSHLVRSCVSELLVPHPTGEDHDGFTAFTELVGDRPALLVVDGAWALEPRGDKLALLLQDCPQLRLLVTSERPWEVQGERVFLLAPLELPRERDENEPDTLERVPSVRLFLERVRRARPGYVLMPGDVRAVAEICRQLDGLPMALRAAASWLVVYELDTLRRSLESDPTELLNHLAGADGSGSTQGALQRCLRQLPPEDQALLAALCERGGEFGLQDVVEVTGRSLPDAGRMVRSLLTHGVVRPCYETGRFHFEVLNVVLAFHLTLS
ncbi:helix-turn-helix domain-containing protein [Allorhizocola rhizosphaerae]|uniref:helix-turn-helix domain-containing protein n=1 Tax=Allorhizocola rhizosphaerae TaxID=1872709 RepID=UPI000E3D01F3|nr:helix-turn-helix domain-containing protein [Allorhizocola rhizosphaerae]